MGVNETRETKMADIRGELEAIHEQYGYLTPKLVVEEARDPDHVLHNRFEWDDSVAAENWRYEQAHRLIQKCKIVYREADETTEQKSVRAFHAVRSERGHVYEPVDNVINDEFTRQLVLKDMQRDWQSLRRRYQNFEEFLDMVRADVDEAAA
jgi:hypothetical protein